MTEQQHIKSFVYNFWKYWLGAAIIGLALGFILVSQLKPKYEGSVTFGLKKEPQVDQSKATFYTYDGYYSEQSAILARNSFMAWLIAPQTVDAVYKAAQVSLGKQSVESLSRVFKVNEVQNVNTVDLSFSASKRSDAEKIGAAVVDQVAKMYKGNDTTIQAQTPLVLEVFPPKNLVALAVALATTLAVFFISLLVHYFKPEK